MGDHFNDYLDGKLGTTDGEVPRNFNHPAPNPEHDDTGQHRSYWVLTERERQKGFIRPVRTMYRHLRCGRNTSMGKAIAETYAAQPSFYGATFCVHCGGHYPVGVEGEFVWVDGNGYPLDEKVGT